MHKTTLAGAGAGGNFSVLFRWRKFTSARQCLTTGNQPLEVAPEQWKTHVNSNEHQTVDRGKVSPRVTDLPPVKQLPWDHVNRP